MNIKVITTSVAAICGTAVAADFYVARLKNKKNAKLIRIATERVTRRVANGEVTTWDQIMTDIEFEIIAIKNR